jgi:hypothetical protein
LSYTLRTLKPPAIEPVTVEQLMAHARIDTDADDFLLAGYITAARMWIESYLNRALITQTLSLSAGHHQQYGPMAPIEPLLSFPMGWAGDLRRKPLELPRCPVQSVTSVSRYDPTVDAFTAIDPSLWRVNTAYDPVSIRIHPNGLAGCHEGVQIVFVAGYGDTATTIDVPIIQALLLLTTFFYENRGDTDADVPKVVEYLLTPYRVMFFGG